MLAHSASTAISMPPPYRRSVTSGSQLRVVITDGKVCFAIYKPSQFGCPPTLTSLTRFASGLENDVN